MVRLVRTAYQDSKRYTAQVSTWLMQTALQYGFPASSFGLSSQPLADDEGRTAQQRKNATKKAKLKAKKKAQGQKQAQVQGSAANDEAQPGGAIGESGETQQGDGKEEGQKEFDGQKGNEPSALLEGNYVLKVQQFTEIAHFLVKEDVVIPTELMLLIRGCVRMRRRCMKPFLSQPDESTLTHNYFIDVLCKVFEILEEHRQAQANAAAAAASTKEPSAPTSSQTNRFLLLEEPGGAGDEDEEEDELMDIQLPETPRPSKSSVSAAKVRADVEDTMETALDLLLLFFADLHSVRDFIKALWADFHESKVDLLTASVTTNTALELLRRPHDEVMARVLPFFGGELNMATWSLVNYRRWKQQRGNMQPHELRLYHFVSFLTGRVRDPALEHLYDYFFVPNLQILSDLGREMVDQPGGFPVYDQSSFDASLDFKVADFKTRWIHGRDLIHNWFGDYMMLVRADIPIVRKRSTSANSGGAQLNPFRMDETSIEMETFARTCKPSLLLVFQSQIFVDINFALGSFAKRGLGELRIRAYDMHDAIDKRKDTEHDAKPNGWTADDEELMSNFQNEAKMWMRREDLVTLQRRVFTHANQPPATLMPRNPVLCGLLCFRLQLTYQQLGLRLANAYKSVMSCAHLVVAYRHSGSEPGKSDPVWPDMDKILEMHGTDIFGGKVPENVIESQSAYMRQTGASAEMLQSLRHQGSVSSLHPSKVLKQKASRALQDHPQMLPIYLARFIGDASGTCLERGVIEVLLKDIKLRDKQEEAKQQRKEAAGGTASVKRKLLRKERSHHDAKFTIPQLLSVLEAGLRRETESIRFDYVVMNIRCLATLTEVFNQATQRVRAGLDQREPLSRLQTMDQMHLVTCYVLHIAATTQHAAEREKRGNKDAHAAHGTLLCAATEAFNNFFKTNEGEESVVLRQMRENRGRDWDRMVADIPW